MTQLPFAMIQAVRGQRVVLFLGAGASMEATDAKGQRPPNAAQLREKLGLHFYGKPMEDYDLMSLSEMAIASHSQALVFEQIKTILEPFNPSAAHRLMASFRWRAIATTNYDLLIDNAYGLERTRLQTLVTFVKDREPIEERLQRTASPVQYLKLHGCLNHLHDGEVPLILSHEHYSRYARHRKRLYDRLIGWAHESAFIFIGYGLGDAHIRKIIYDLSETSGQRPTYYVVAPGVRDHDSAFWSTKNVTLIDATFGTFMAGLDAAIPENSRKLLIPPVVQSNPISSHFRTQSTLSERLEAALANNLVHVYPQMQMAPQDARKFYEGFDTGWGAMAQRLDVPRKPVEDLLYDAVIDPPTQPEPTMFVFTGPAGAGKTIALKRAAWETAASCGELGLWVNESTPVLHELVTELYGLTGKRIYLFIDRVALHIEAVKAVYVTAKLKSIPVTIVGAERLNEWNVYCGELDKIAAPTDLAISYLSQAEIEGLVDLLTRHNALGLLVSKSRDDQIKAFSERAERQLLVALHELTRGKPFEEIVLDEYKRIVPEQARRLYLDICTMHQYGVPARAGTISRISGVRFTDFQDELFKPLEDVVLTARVGGDFQYKARHTRVAELVFLGACQSDIERADQLVRIVGGLDIGYSIDRKTLEEIARHGSLEKTLSTADAGRAVYRACLEVAPDAPWILQQWALFELNHSLGNMEQADALIRQAAEFDTKSKSIKHSHAEICRRRANDASSPLVKEQLRRLARDRLDEARAERDNYILGTRCKILLDEVSELAQSLSDPPTESQQAFFRDKVRDAETALARAKQLYADDSEINQIEAKLSTILKQQSRAVRALERAWAAQPKGSSVAIRLAHHYSDTDQDQRSVEVLESALERNPSDKGAHLEMAKHLITKELQRRSLIDQHLAASYTLNDQNHEARYLHAQFFFLDGKVAEAAKLFQTIDATAPDDFRQRAPASNTIVTERLQRYRGTIANLRATIAFISTTAYPANIFSHQSATSRETWRSLRPGDAVTFEIRFNRSGPVAIDLAHVDQ